MKYQMINQLWFSVPILILQFFMLLFEFKSSDSKEIHCQKWAYQNIGL